jgi:hypothetical protein
MRNSIGKHLAGPLALATAIVLWGGPRADAGFQVTLGAGGATKTIVDGGTGDFDGAANSIISISETLGGYTFTLTLATTNTPGGPTLAFTTASTGMISGRGATTITIYASANGFTMPSSPPDLRASSGSTAQFLPGTVTNNKADHSYKAYYDATNALSTSAAGTVIGSGGTVEITAPSGNSNLSDSQVFSASTIPYALNLDLMAVLKNGGQNVLDLDGEVQVAPVPEPTTLALAFTAIPLFGGLYLHRRSRQVA